jgi:hypothetical protein
MEYGKAALAVVLIILSILGFGLTWLLYVIFNIWNTTYPFNSALQTVGNALYWVLPLLAAIFSLMFMLLGLYLLYKSIKRPKNID